MMVVLGGILTEVLDDNDSCSPKWWLFGLMTIAPMVDRVMLVIFQEVVTLCLNFSHAG